VKHLRSLREFVDALDGIGDLQRIDREVDWNLEVGAIIRRSYDLQAPAPLFTNLTGYQDTGFGLLGAPGALSASGHPLARVALALGLPAEAPGQQIIEVLVAARHAEGIPPVVVAREDAPCKQNVMTGGDIDLLAFPTPLIHGNDGGRYIQTYGMNIAKTPDGTWTNWSINRMMIAGKDTLACLIPPPQHLGIIRAQWTERSPTGTTPSKPSSPPAHPWRRTTLSSARPAPPRSCTSCARPACRPPRRGIPTRPRCTGWTRSHPERGEFHFPHKVSDQLAVYLSPEESHTFTAGKVVYNCLLADLYPDGGRPIKGSFDNGWPREIRQRVIDSWQTYGYNHEPQA
jgi:3-octaprenyl-4-hydroxybenzoate carboxy-lyase